MKIRPLLAATGLLLVSVALLSVLSEGVARLSMPHWREFSSERFLNRTTIPGQGSVIISRPEFDGYFAQNKGDFRVRVRINGFGLRQPEPPEAAAGRIWVVGDSFTFGWGVEESEMYSSALSRLTGIPTYNVASPGADICGYQRLVGRMGKDLVPRIIIVGLSIENDVLAYTPPCSTPSDPGPSAAAYRFLSLSIWKEWATIHSALYNFLAVSLKKNPIVFRWLTAVGLIEPLSVGSFHAPVGQAALRAAARSVDETALIAASFKERPPIVVLIIPSRFEVLNRDPTWTKLREMFVAELSSRAITVADPTQDLIAAGYDKIHFSNDGHWTPAAHVIAAQVLA